MRWNVIFADTSCKAFVIEHVLTGQVDSNLIFRPSEELQYTIFSVCMKISCKILSLLF